MGHDVSGQRPRRDVSRASSGSGRRASTSTSATTRRRCHRGARRSVADLDRHSRPTTPRWSRPPASRRPRCRVLHARRSSPRSASTPSDVAVAGTHGKTTTSSMLALVLVEAGLRPSFIVGGELNELGDGRGVGRRRVVRRRGRRERRHLRRARRRDRRRHQRRGRPPRPLRVVARRIEAAFDRFLAERPGPNRASASTSRAPPGSAPRRGAVTYGTDDGSRLPHRRIDRSSAPACAFTLDREPASARSTSSSPLPGLHNARNAAAAIALAHADRRARRRSPRGAGRLRRRRPPVRVARRGVRRHARRRLRAHSGQGGGRARRGPSAAAGTASSRVLPAAPLQPHGSAGPRLRRRLRRRRRASSSPTSMRPARRRCPASPASSLVDAVLDAHPRQRVVWLPDRRRRSSPYLAGELRAGRPVPDPRRGRPHRRCPTSSSPRRSR